MPSSYLVLFNIAKRNNLGNLVRTADALGVTEIIVVGRKQFHALGAFGTEKGSKLRHYYKMDQALENLRARGCEIVAIEITQGAAMVDRDPFSRDTAFLVGNEGTGLTSAQLAACDRAVAIPQFGSGASLNVNVAAAIVLHRFASWAGFRPCPHRNGKFRSDLVEAQTDQKA